MTRVILKGGLLVVLFLFVFSFTAQAEEAVPTEPVPVLYDSSVPNELGVDTEKALANGFWHNLWRKAEIFFTVDPIKKAEKRLTWANENLVKAQVKAENEGEAVVLDQAVQEFDKQIEKVQEALPKLKIQREGDERVEDLLGQVNSQRVRQVDILQKIEESISSPAFKDLIAKVKRRVEQKVEEVPEAPASSVTPKPVSKPATSQKKNLQARPKPVKPEPVPRKNTDPEPVPPSTSSGSNEEPVEPVVEPEPEVESEAEEAPSANLTSPPPANSGSSSGGGGVRSTPSVISNPSVYTHPYSGTYQITYDFSNVEVAIGGSKTTVSLDDISSGDAKIGTVDIPAEIADDLREVLDTKVEFVIAEKGLINHPISMKDVATGEVANGSYDPRLEKFVFGNLSSVDPASKDCGAIGGSLWGGHFANSGISEASSTVGFIGGCKGILVAARAKIPWTAVKITN